MSNPLVDLAGKTTEELLELNKEYTKKLYSLSGDNPLYNNILGLREQVQFEYSERMQLQIHKDKLKGDKEQIIEIGEIESIAYGLDPDDANKFVTAVANTYIKKSNNENNTP
jgi:hypothetical protein